MRALLDTHAFLWWLDGDSSLSAEAHECISARDLPIFVSAASAWEIATKHRIGRLPKAADVARDVAGCLRDQGFHPLPITVQHGQRAGALPGHHRDPFDRMLIAQAILEDCTLISNETIFDSYSVARLW